MLPRVLPSLKQVDVFVHNSSHTYWNIQREFRLVLPYLPPKAGVLADDVKENHAFWEWMEQLHPTFWAVIKEMGKKESFIIGIK